MEFLIRQYAFFTGLCGIPENLIQALLETDKKGFTAVSNNAGKKKTFDILSSTHYHVHLFF
jgi:acyl CoA:acetate/3-ketoacid CoA transferase alpha subunit